MSVACLEQVLDLIKELCFNLLHGLKFKNIVIYPTCPPLVLFIFSC